MCPVCQELGLVCYYRDKCQRTVTLEPFAMQNVVVKERSFRSDVLLWLTCFEILP